MDGKSEHEIKRDLAISVQKALSNHRVNPENISETANFLAYVIGEMIRVLIPENMHGETIEDLKKEIEYGIKHGIPG